MLLRFLFLLAFLPLSLVAQKTAPDFYLSNTPRFLNQFNDTLPNAFAGGLRNPQVYNLDFNKDGEQDLIVFDGRDGTILPFEVVNKDNGRQYTYAPAYQPAFPKNDLYKALKVRDYNADGRQDLFFNNGGGLSVFKQTADSSLQFVKVEDELMSRDVVFCPDTCPARVFTPPTDIPGIADVDNDGDLDILTFGSTYLTLYRNLAMEDPTLTRDSLAFELANACFGSFRESGSGSNIPDLNIQCPGFRRQSKRHAGANILLFDGNNDGDQDMIYGDVGFRNMVYLENGKSDTNYPIDTFVDANASYPSDRPLDLQEFPAAFRPEISGDSLKDLVFTPQAEVNGRTKNQLWYYTNTGTAANPSFTYQGNDLLQNTMLDFGGHSAPAFFDFNGDGTQDLLVAADRNTDAGGSFLVLLENVGSDQRPVYKVKNRNYLQLKKDSLLLLSPAVGDLNNDQVPDLLLGTAEGRLLYYQNQSSQGEKARFRQVSTFLDSIDIGRGSAPAIADINGDGLKDLLIGTSFMDLFYYQQQSTGSGPPNFRLITDTFGGIQRERFAFLRPAVADLDQNNSPDLLLGTRTGGLKLYANFQQYLRNDKPFPKAELNARVPGSNQNIDRLSYFLEPAIHNQGKDSLPDVYLGNIRGGLIYLGTQAKRDTLDDVTGQEPVSRSKKDYSLYPNPATSNLYLNWETKSASKAPLTFRIRDLKGRVVKTSRFDSKASGPFHLNVSHLTPGMYITTLRTADGQLAGRKRLVVTP